MRRHERDAPLHHARAKLAEPLAEDALGLRQEPGLLVGDVMYHLAHQFHHARVVLRFRRVGGAQLADEAAHAVVLRNEAADKRAVDARHGWVKDFLFDLCMHVQREADGRHERALGGGGRFGLVAVEGREDAGMICPDHVRRVRGELGKNGSHIRRLARTGPVDAIAGLRDTATAGCGVGWPDNQGEVS